MLGVDPRPLTLRELFWMLEGRRGHDGSLIAWHLTHILAFVTGTYLELSTFDPWADRKPKVKSPARAAAENKLGWSMLRKCWGGPSDEELDRIRANVCT